MDFVSAISLGIVQGLTEFLPISSSGHLVVLRIFLKEHGYSLPESPLAFDVLIHFATLLVSLSYLRRDILRFAKRSLTSQKEFWELFWPCFLGTLPAGLTGLIIVKFFDNCFEGKRFLASGFVLTALILEFAHRKSLALIGQDEDPDNWQMPSKRQALIIGIFQAFAILPSLSRSGATVGAALFLGLSRTASLKFSFLISVPVIFAATLLELPELAGSKQEDVLSYFLGFLMSLVFGWISIRLLEVFVKGAKLRWFGFYVLALGLGLGAYWGVV